MMFPVPHPPADLVVSGLVDGCTKLDPKNPRGMRKRRIIKLTGRANALIEDSLPEGPCIKPGACIRYGSRGTSTTVQSGNSIKRPRFRLKNETYFKLTTFLRTETLCRLRMGIK
jgi:hypothetical protein